MDQSPGLHDAVVRLNVFQLGWNPCDVGDMDRRQGRLAYDINNLFSFVTGFSQ